MGSAPTPPYPARETEPSPTLAACQFLAFGPSIWPPRYPPTTLPAKRCCAKSLPKKHKQQALNAPMNTDAVRVKAPGSPGFLIGPGRIVPAERQHFNLVDYQRDQIALGLLVSARPQVFDLLAKRAYSPVSGWSRAAPSAA
jgi:hypothetical protein